MKHIHLVILLWILHTTLILIGDFMLPTHDSILILWTIALFPLSIYTTLCFMDNKWDNYVSDKEWWQRL